MNIAGHQKMFGPPGPPSSFNYIGIKFIGHRRLRAYSNLSSYQSTSGGQYDQTMFQFSRVDFIDANNSYYSYPNGMTIQNHLMFNGRKMRTQPVLLSVYTGDGHIQRIFDHSTNTKFCVSWWTGWGAATDMYDFTDSSYSAPEANRPYAYNLRSSYDRQYYENTIGVYNRPQPFCSIIDLTSNPLDIKTYSRWQWYTANDTASAPAGSGQRQWIEGEIIGSANGKTWWRLDVFNDIDMPTVNYGLAYTGNLKPRKGDIWSDLDLSTRDWTNGIQVDNY